MRRQQGKRQTSSIHKEGRLEQLTNGEAIEFLSTLPQNHPFGIPENDEKREFLRRLYFPLRDLFSTSTTSSRANRTRVLEISRFEVLESLAQRFRVFETDPLEFWERLSEALPQYDKHGAEKRPKTFLEGAVQLDTNIQEQLILQRFVSVAAYKLFRRAMPSSGTRIMPESLRRFLMHVGICYSGSCEGEDIDKYGDIIKRGRRYAHFCQRLVASQTIDEDREGDNEAYGPLFFSSLPDTMEVNASQMAKVLLDFHKTFVWVNEMPQRSLGKRKKNDQGHETTRKNRGRSEYLEPSLAAATSQEQDFRPVGGSMLQPRLALERTREGCFQSSIALDSNPVWRISQTRAPSECLLRLPEITQREQRRAEIAPGSSTRTEERSRFDTLVSAACSTDTAEQFQERAAGNMSVDFVPLPAHSQETLLDVTALDFVVPLLDVTDLDFVDPQSSMFSQLHSYEQDI
ncbi:hypothetical protein AtubIFM55763_011636 [Aspergillus tubingensis]|nr:hypothetical protein AtubIFM55763_011636 [Aspergillus tubingensis]